MSVKVESAIIHPICGNCHGRHPTVKCELWCNFCRKFSHPSSQHRCGVCGSQGQHAARDCPDTLFCRLQTGNFKAVEGLRRRGWQFDQRCLDKAVSDGNSEVIELIIDSGDLSDAEAMQCLEGVSTAWFDDHLVWTACQGIKAVLSRGYVVSVETGEEALIFDLAFMCRDEELCLAMMRLGVDPGNLYVVEGAWPDLGTYLSSTPRWRRGERTLRILEYLDENRSMPRLAARLREVGN